MTNNNFTAEQLAAAKEAKSPEELVIMAKEQGFDVTLAQAAAFLDTQTMELADEELDNVAGGGCGDDTQGWKNQAAREGRKIKLEPPYTKVVCSKCKKEYSIYARNKRFVEVKGGRDRTLYEDCKCYNCKTEFGDVEAINKNLFF